MTEPRSFDVTDGRTIGTRIPRNPPVSGPHGLDGIEAGSTAEKTRLAPYERRSEIATELGPAPATFSTTSA